MPVPLSIRDLVSLRRPDNVERRLDELIEDLNLRFRQINDWAKNAASLGHILLSVDGLDSSPFFGFRAATTLTIATGAVTVTQSYHQVDTESAAASDDLDTISGLSEGQFLVLRTVNASRDVTLRDTGGGSGNIRIAAPFENGSGNFVLGDPTHVAVLFHNGTTLAMVAGYNG